MNNDNKILKKWLSRLNVIEPQRITLSLNSFGMLLLCCCLMSGCSNDEGSYTAPNLTILSADSQFGQHGGNGVIMVENTGSTVTAFCSQSWVTSLSVDGTTVSFVVNSNDQISARVGQIILKSGSLNKSVTIMQSSALLSFQSEYTLDADGGTYLIAIPTELKYFAELENANWITSYEMVDGGILITYDATNLDVARSIKVTLTSDRGLNTFTVTQPGYDFGLFPSTVSFTSEGGSESIVVSGTRDYSVSIDVSWLTYKKTTEGGVFIAEVNNGVSTRTVDVTFLDAHGVTYILSITQGASDSYYEDYLGDWILYDDNANTYIVTFSEKVRNESFTMTSPSFEYPIIWNWSANNYGRTLTLYCQQLDRTNTGGRIMVLPALIGSSGGYSFFSTVGYSAAYYTFDGNSTITCTGGTNTTITGFAIYIRNSANDGGIGWYNGGPNRFAKAAVLTR